MALPLRTPTHLAYVAFALVGVAGVLSAWRVVELGRWDAVVERPLEGTGEGTGSREGSGLATADEGLRHINLVTTRAPHADVFVSACREGTGEAALDVRGPVEIRFVRWDWDQPEDAVVAVATSHEVIWSTEPLGEAELGPVAGGPCIFFHGRGEGPGEVQLYWEPGALPGAAEGAVAVQAVVRHPLGWPDRVSVLLLLLAVGLLLSAGQRTAPQAHVPWRPADAVFVLFVFVAASFAAGLVSLTQVGAFAGTLVSFGAYTAAAWVAGARLVPGDPLAALAFHAIPARRWVLCGVVGLGLAVSATIALALMPRGESRMTELLQTSAGLVTVVTLALVSPWTEELLLRGALYGALERRGGALAAVCGTAGLFSLLHLAQHWGNLGPWVVLSAAGLVLSLVRWYTGSSLGSTVTHLAYNLTLSAPALFAG